MSSIHGSVQRQDWQDRDFIEIVSRNIKKISDFLNHFDQSCRGRLAELDGKVTNLERQMDFLEAALDGASYAAAANTATTAAAAPLQQQQQQQQQQPR